MKQLLYYKRFYRDCQSDLEKNSISAFSIIIPIIIKEIWGMYQTLRTHT